MIAMQYDITLPADYDMGIIRRRIADKGHLLDDFPGLVFKAYLHATHDDKELPSRDNHYAPFYLWHGHEGMTTFLTGPGFAGVARDFGRPRVDTWVPWHAALADDLRGAVCAMRECLPLTPDTDLDALHETGHETACREHQSGALATLVAFAPSRWQLLRFALWPEPRPDLAGPRRQLYRIDHVSQPDAPH